MSTATPGVSSAVDERLSWFTRICYGFGDTACNVVAGAMTILTFFYTDYAGVEPTTVGLVMLLSRCFDGVSDVIMGFIVERTNSKWGFGRRGESSDFLAMITTFTRKSSVVLIALRSFSLLYRSCYSLSSINFKFVCCLIRRDSKYSFFVKKFYAL